MTENSSVSGWGEEWMVSQRQFWDAWSNLLKQNLGIQPRPGGFSIPWSDAFELWERALPALGNEAAEDFYGKLVRQTKTFLRVGEEFARLTARMTEAGTSGGDWKGALEARLNELKSMFRGAGSAETIEPLRRFLPAFELPLDTWIRTLSGASLLPGDLVQALKPEGLRQATDELHDRIGKFLSVPAVGYTREWHEQTQATARRTLDYQRALQDYVHAHGRLGADTVERFSKKVMEWAEKGEEITTLRELYDLWVDCGEEAYNTFVLTDEYADIYAGLVNATLALKHQSQCMVDEIAGALNLPTHRGITTLQSRQQDLRRELSGLRAALDEAAIDGIERQVKAIGHELAETDIKAMKGELREVRHEIDGAVLPEVRDALKALAAMGEKLAALERQLRPVVAGVDGGTQAPAATPSRRSRGPRVPSITPARPRQRKGT